MRNLLTILTFTLVTSGCSGNGGAGDDDACPALTQTTTDGTVHETQVISDDTTWSAADSPHRIEGIVQIESGTLTIEPCARVVSTLASGLAVFGTGKISAVGTADKPIKFDTAETGNLWGNIEVGTVGDPGGYLDLEYATLVHGGGDGGDGSQPNSFDRGVVTLFGDHVDEEDLVDRGKLVSVTIDGSGGYGLDLRYGSTLNSASTALTIKNTTLGPIHAALNTVFSIPTGTYTGNTTNTIVIYRNVTALLANLTLRNYGVPYRLGEVDSSKDDYIFGSTAAPAKLTIEPGVTVQVTPRDSIEIAGGSSLVAPGTSAAPIIFTSAAESPAAGDWIGLIFDAAVAPTNILSYVTVAYAGADDGAEGMHCTMDGDPSTDEDSAIRLYGQPPSEFITNSTLHDISGVGIDRAYEGDAVDFEATNIFTNVEGCKQSFPPSTDDVCPASSPCD
jgi:hypothetical protein